MYYIDFPDEYYVCKLKLLGYFDNGIISMEDNFLKFRNVKDFKLTLCDTGDNSKKKVYMSDIYKLMHTYNIPIVNINISSAIFYNKNYYFMNLLKLGSISEQWHYVQHSNYYFTEYISTSTGFDTYLLDVDDTICYNGTKLPIDDDATLIYISNCGKYACILVSNRMLLFHERSLIDVYVLRKTLSIKSESDLIKYNYDRILEIIKRNCEV